MFDESYTALCSAITLQSNKDGFFSHFTQNVTNSVNEVWLNEFKNLSNLERISKCLTDEKVKDIVIDTLENVQEVFRGKSSRLSEQRKAEAEHFYNEGKLEKSALMYTQSIIRAPSTDSSALWGRSTVFWDLKKYQLCLDDVKLCLQQKLREELKLEAYWRMVECYEKLGMIEQARISANIIFKLMTTDKYGGERLWKEKVQSKIEELANNERKTDVKAKDNLTNNLGETHPIFECTSKNLHLAEDQTAGKYFTAGDQINTGDTLVVEDPYVCCLLPEKFGTHCHHCLKRLETALPCHDCSAVAFCSFNCRSIGLKTYHKYECHYMDLMIGSGMSILSFAALRIVTQQNLKYFTNKENGKNKSPYEHVYNLINHEDKRNGVDFLHRTLMALFLLAVLKKSGYFPDPGNMENITAEELSIGKILLRNLEVLQFNAHEIFEPVAFKNKEYLTALNIGIGLYKTASYFNHDCYPSVSRYFNGTKLHIKSLRPISKGHFVGDNYGLVFTKHSLEERQKKLWSRYWFKCGCQCCSENWPKLNEIDPNIFILKCMKCNKHVVLNKDENEKPKNIRCKRCSTPVLPLFDIIKLLIREIDSLTTDEKILSKEELQKLCKLQDSLILRLEAPHPIYGKIQGKLSQHWMNNETVYRIS